MDHKKIATLISCTLMTGWIGSAGAQEIYRCGDSYSQKPCPGGGGKVVQVEDERSASQRSQTTQAAQRDAKAADAMEKARLVEEAKAAPLSVLAGRAAEPVVETPSPVITKGKAKKPAYFTAVAPKKPGDEASKKRKKRAAV